MKFCGGKDGEAEVLAERLGGGRGGAATAAAPHPFRPAFARAPAAASLALHRPFGRDW